MLAPIALVSIVSGRRLSSRNRFLQEDEDTNFHNGLHHGSEESGTIV